VPACSAVVEPPFQLGYIFHMQENETGGMYFESPKQAVEVISDLLSKGDWKTLSRYYDLSGTETSRRDLESGRFFLREQKPEASHPGGFWRHRHPFAPGFEYHFHHDEGKDTVVVSLRIEIDQGAGMIQEGRTVFKMRKSAPGYQVLPELL